VKFAIFPALVTLLLIARVSATQQRPSRQNASRASSKQTQTPVAAELEKRLRAAQAAQQSDDANAVASANKSLIAFCLRQMGHLRLYEGAFGQASELYRRSLDFEDIPDARVDLAIALLRANRLDETLAETSRVLAADSNNARAWNVQGKAWMKKQDPHKAAESLARSISIQPDFEAAYSLGISLLADKQREKADAIFHQMVEFAGDSGAIRVLFARAYRDANLMDDTLRELKKAIALDPSTPHAHYFLGLSYLILNEWAPTPESRAEFLKELHYHPQDFLSNYFLGVITSINHEFAQSNHYLRVAVGIDPTSPHAWLYLGLNAHAMNDDQHAEEYLRKAIALAGDQLSEANYLIRKGYVTLGRILVQTGRNAEAGPYLKKARELQNLALAESFKKVADVQSESGVGSGAVVSPYVPPTEQEVSLPQPGPVDPTAQVDATVLARSSLTAKQKEQAAAQEKQLRAILGAGFNDLATSEAKRELYRAAVGHYQEAQRWSSEIPGLSRNLGIAAFRTEDYPEAIRALSKAIEDAPSDAEARGMLGLAYFATNDYSNAARTIAPLGETARHDFGLGYAWAASLARKGDPKEAADVLGDVEKLSLDPGSLLLLGQLWVEIEDYARAVTAFHRGLQMDSKFPKLHYYCGLALLRDNRPADAAQELLAELSLFPDDYEATYSLGYAYLQQSRREEATALFRSVISINPGHAKAQYQLGKILLDQGDIKEAIVHLEEAARLDPETDYIHYQLQAAYRKDSRIEDADRELQLYRDLKAKHRKLDLPKPEEP
jgi:tetratricopeptide (TPR) repeat protein